VYLPFASLCSDGVNVCDTRMQSERFVKGEIVPIVHGDCLVYVGATLARLPHFSLILLCIRKLAILFHFPPFFFRPFFFGTLSKGESNEGKSKVGRLNEGISKGD